MSSLRFTVSEEFKQRVKKQAEKDGLTMAALCKEAVSEYLHKREMAEIGRWLKDE